MRRCSVLAAVVVVLGACGGEPPAAQPGDSVAGHTSGAALADSAPAVSLPERPALSPAADSVAQRLVFLPTTDRWFLVAERRHRLLLDLGRVDMDLTRPASRMAAYREAVTRLSPLREGARLLVRGRWGLGQLEVTGFDAWNGRIVAVLGMTGDLTALAATPDTLLGIAERAPDDSRPARPDSLCTVPPDTASGARLRAIGDSLVALLRERNRPPLPRLEASLRDRVSWVRGCFGDPGAARSATGGAAAGAVLFATLWAGDHEWVRERAVLVDSAGRARTLEVSDYRFRAHEALQAFDADGDGRDDVAARGFMERAGGVVVLRLADGRLARLASGFAWERGS